MVTVVNEFFDTSAFAEEAVFILNATTETAPTVIPIIFTEAGTTSIVRGVSYTNSTPEALCKTSDIPGASARSTLEVRGEVLYILPPVLADGTGITTLKLSRSAPRG
jgi:hypothetical protein